MLIPSFPTTASSLAAHPLFNVQACFARDLASHLVICRLLSSRYVFHYGESQLTGSTPIPQVSATIQPPGIPGDPAGLSPNETPIQARKIAALPRCFRGKQNLEKGLAQSNNALILGPFRSLVASPATPNTPTPVPTLGSGYNCETFMFAPR